MKRLGLLVVLIVLKLIIEFQNRTRMLGRVNTTQTYFQKLVLFLFSSAR